MASFQRRTVLTAVSTATVSALAGCTDLLADGSDDGDTSAAEDAAVTFVETLADGEFEEAREEFIPEMRDDIATLGQLEQAWLGYTAIGGEFEGVESTTADKQDGVYNVRITMSFERGSHDLLFAMNDEYEYGEYAPADEYERPAYVDAAAITDEEVTLETDDDECELSGLVTMPEGGDDVPGVVLVHDAGQVSMDSDTTATKLFGDLAEGLASQGIATIRYDSRLYECDIDPDDHGIDTVTVDDSLTAIDELRDTDGVDSDEIVVVGHGFGGLVAPRIADEDGDLAGIVGLAAPARPFYEVTLEQIEHQAAVGDHEWEARRDQYEEWEEDVERIEDGDYDADEPVCGYYGSLWESLEDYDHVETSASLELPTYFLQGERDTRATVEDDLERWESDLEDPDPETTVYDDLNRAFMPGEGPPTPMEYDLRNNVDEQVVDDIAAWIQDL